MNNLFTVKYAIVFQKDGLDETLFDNLNGIYGTFIDRTDHEIDECGSVVIAYFEGSVFEYSKLKRDLCCAEPVKYVLFPMESEEDKKLIESEWKQLI